jgi:hypothetical protein
MEICCCRGLVDLLRLLPQPSTEAEMSFTLPFLPFTSFQKLLKMDPNEKYNHFIETC